MMERLKQQLTVALIAALTAWFAMLPWSGFAQAWTDYLYPLVLLGLLLALTGALARALVPSRILVTLVQLLVALVALHVTLTGTFDVGRSTLREIQTLLANSVDTAQSYHAPIPDTVTELTPMMLVLGVAVFWAFDLLSLTWRRPSLGGLLLLATLTAVASVLDEPIGWLPFVLTAVAYIGLLGTVHESALRRWAAPGESSVLKDSRGPWRLSSRSTSMRLGLGATGLALVVPVLVPTVGDGVLESLRSGFDSVGSGGGTGLRSPLLDMKRNLDRGEDVPLVDVVSRDGARPTYLRIAVLDAFDGNTWSQDSRTPVEATDSLQVPGLPAAERAAPVVTYDIHTLRGYDAATFPVPYPPGLLLDGRRPLAVDLATWEVYPATKSNNPADDWVRISQYRGELDQKALVDAGNPPALITSRNTDLPFQVPPWVWKTADEVTQGATSNFQKAVMLQDWFRYGGGFTYSLESSSGSGLDQMRTFLGTGPDSRIGYCEQFATAMALLGRYLGIPSRVVVGFLDPEYQGDDTWQFSAHDLHAWPEMYFAGSGWVRFEPTPATRSGLPPTYTFGVLPTPDQSQSALPSDQPTASRLPSVNPNKQKEPIEASSGTAPTAQSGGWGWLWWLLLLLVGAPRAAAWAVRRWRWRRADTAPARAEAAWRQVNDAARDLGLSPAGSPTVRTRLDHLRRNLAPKGHRPGDPVRTVDPVAVERLSRLATAVEVGRYAPGHDPEWVTDEDVRVCVNALRRASGDRRRRRVAWLPRAVFQPAR